MDGYWDGFPRTSKGAADIGISLRRSVGGLPGQECLRRRHVMVDHRFVDVDAGDCSAPMTRARLRRRIVSRCSPVIAAILGAQRSLAYLPRSSTQTSTFQ